MRAATRKERWWTSRGIIPPVEVFQHRVVMARKRRLREQVRDLIQRHAKGRSDATH